MPDTIFYIDDKKEIQKYVDLISRNTRTLCENIGAVYWRNIRKSIDFLYVLGKPINSYSMSSELIKGFLIGTRKPGKDLHVLLVCAKRGTAGVGMQLLNRLIEDAQKEGYPQVTLEALPQVINYYRNKFNFKISRSCSESPAVTQLADQIKDRRYISIEESHADPDMVALLNQVIDMGFSEDPKCLEMKQENNPDYLYTCSSSGYVMTLCLDQPKKRSRAENPNSKRIRTAK